ncbi:hypothetical protein JTE90_016831 [Oedothorax gibbosus]|uniref:Uncharacterized protein n=1 Tax=Oedothorax gibbosus TaxID=931172 RepID=A0AAV6W0Q1_9ARAC|nr:hypothetical protein JTE90_016831 [Oedothorax gibbosus]
MATYYRQKLYRRQKACLVTSVFILVLGLAQLALGVLFSLKPKHRKCHKPKHMLFGVYLVVAGIAGLASYWPRGSQARARGSVALFVVFCGLASVMVILDNTAFGCVTNHANEGSMQLYTILGIVEVTGMYLAHLLCALCIGLSCPDIWSHKNKLVSKSEKLLNSSRKMKSSKQALHLPEAYTHIQEATGTGEKVTVVSLPESEGIVYAVPEEQYVIRRGDATYMAPVGNTQLTAFFPTYRNQAD